MKSRRSQQRGHVILTVLIILFLLLSAGAYALRAADSEIRASARFKRAEMLFRAADAGGVERLGEASLASDPWTIFQNPTSPLMVSWRSWPDSTIGFSTLHPSDLNRFLYRTGPMRMRWSGQTPPPGVPVGTNTFIFEFSSFATFDTSNDPSGLDAAEASVGIAFKTWDSLPGSYAP